MHSRFFAAALAVPVVIAASPVSARAQNFPSQQPAYTFHAGTRVVLTDVTVMDRLGNPVHGLTASDFEIYDNGKTQTIASFQEHTTTPVTSLPRVSTAPGVYSNAFLEHLPPVLNIIVLDITNLEIPDQMYLNERLTRFFKSLPAGEPVAIYWRDGPASLLLQTFTSNHALLLAALHKALPRIPPPARIYYNDLVTLHQIALDFGQYPGRKNILWFSGGSSLYLKPDPNDLPTILDWRTIYDELETSRIAIYPIDARGLMLRDSYGIWLQHALMDDIARTTGGQAYYNTNGFDEAAADWLNTSGDFYTLTYSPRNFRADKSWHKVKVILNFKASGYKLSYRQGYFADDTGSHGAHQEKKPGTIRLAGESTAAPDRRSAPIVFKAHVVAASIQPGGAASASQPRPERGTIPYDIHYLFPVNAFTLKTINGKHAVEFGVAALSFDENGKMVARLGNRVTLAFDPADFHRGPSTYFDFDQHIDLPRGQNYLYLAVWDMASGRLGTLRVPFQASTVPKHP